MRALLLALLVTTGCTDKKEATKSDPAPTAQRHADDKATEDLEARNSAKADVATAQTNADAIAARAHADAGAQVQKDFDATARRLNELEVKAANATGATKERAASAIVDVHAREATVMASIAKLRDVSGARWDTTKAQVDSDMVALNQSIDALEKTLK